MLPRVSVNGIEMAYREAGRGPRPFVLVHGFTGLSRDFEEQIPALATLGRTLAPDLRGHGQSTNTSDAASYSFDRLADDLRAFLDALGIRACDLLGHSMGGMLALRFALAHPERVLSLVLMDTAARPVKGLPREVFEAGGRIASEAGMQRLYDIIRNQSEIDPLRTAADRRLQREWGDYYWERSRERMLSMDPVAFGALGAEVFDQAPLSPRLCEIRVPTLVMVGEQDASFLEAAEELAREIPGSRRAVIPDAGHSPQVEAPEAWLAEIQKHLADVRGGSSSGA